ncbi:MAG: SMP-30/gluconolactonase/LRE family protein, partial [Parvularculaceae bacterium]
LAVLVLYVLSNLIPASGAFVTLENKLVDRCTRLDIAPGAEDVTVDPDTDLAFVSASDHRASFNGRPAPGGIYVFDVSTHDAARLVSLDAPADFQPHGLSLWHGADGEKRLFVVNHPFAGGHTVEIFDVGEGGALAHAESVAFKAMHSPNDVLAVGSRQFYATNDRGYDGGLLGLLEGYLALPFASAVYYDGAEGRIIKKGLVYANGINMSADGSTVYIAEFLKRRVGVYARDAATGALKRERLISVNTGPDNIEVAKDGALWIAGHSKVFEFLKHAEDPSAIAPSHVIRVNPRTRNKSDVFIDTTGTINASSVGAVWDKTLIVGAVFDGHVMVCPMIEIFLSGDS